MVEIKWEESLYMPNQKHFYQLAMRGLEIIWLGRARRNISNPLSPIVIITLSLLPVFVSQGLAHQNLSVFCAIMRSLHYSFTSIHLRNAFLLANAKWPDIIQYSYHLVLRIN
ncbi:MAG: hypothetical protein ACI85H_000341 [Paracoccaceae bacterium]